MIGLSIALKLVHVAALAVWVAGLIFLPALFAAYPRRSGLVEMRRLRAMSRFGFVVIVSPAAVLTVVSGMGLIYVEGFAGYWLMLKLTVVTGMVLFHILCGWLIGKLHDEPEFWAPARHRALIALPVAMVPVVLWLVLGKPI